MREHQARVGGRAGSWFLKDKQVSARQTWGGGGKQGQGLLGKGRSFISKESQGIKQPVQGPRSPSSGLEESVLVWRSVRKRMREIDGASDTARDTARPVGPYVPSEDDGPYPD